MQMTVIKIVAFVIFVISCIAIYHNTNSYEPKVRILFIIVRNDNHVWRNKCYLCNGHKRNKCN